MATGVARGPFGGKEFAHAAEALLLLAERAPVEFSVCAFTVEQGKFLRPVEPLGDLPAPARRCLDLFSRRALPAFARDQPDHGCDLCSRYRRRAVYEIGRSLGANVIAFGHTADDFASAAAQYVIHRPLSALPL